MREYNIMMLRPHVRPGGRIHHDPERQSRDTRQRSAVSATESGRRGRGLIILGGILLSALLAL